MDEMHDEQAWLRGGSAGCGMSGWQPQPGKDSQQQGQGQGQGQHSLQQLREADPFAEFGEWPTDRADGAGFSAASSSSSWQSSMDEHDSTFPSAYPLFADPSGHSLPSPSHQHKAASTFSSSQYLRGLDGRDSLHSAAAASPSSAQWPSRTTTPSLADLSSPSLSLASTVASSSASSTLSSTPSSVSSSSPASPLVYSHSEAPRKPDSIRVPPFDSASSPPRPAFVSNASPSASSHIFASSSHLPTASTAEPGRYQSRDMTGHTPIFSSNSVSPPNLPPRVLLPPHTQAQPYQDIPPPPPAVAQFLSNSSERPFSPPVTFRCTNIAASPPQLTSELHSHLQPLQPQLDSGKERRQTSIRATRKSVESSPISATPRVAPSSQPPTMATASVVPTQSLPALPKRKSARKLGVMIDVPVKPNQAAAAALSRTGLTPPKSRRTMNRPGAFSPQSFVSSPPSPGRPLASPVIAATISPLTENRTMRATGVTIASPIDANARLMPYLANGTPTSPTAAAAVSSFAPFLSQLQHNASMLAARAVPLYNDGSRGMAAFGQLGQFSQPQQSPSLHAKQREEFKSNDEAPLQSALSRFPADDRSLPSTPYSPASSTHDVLGRMGGGPASATASLDSAWSRQYSAPAATSHHSFSQLSDELQAGHAGRNGASSYAGLQQHQQQPAMSRSVSSSQHGRTTAGVGATSAAWAEQHYGSGARVSQPSTPHDSSPYTDLGLSHNSLPSQRQTYFDETSTNASIALAAKLSAMQRATSAPAQPPLAQAHSLNGRQRVDLDSHSTSTERQHTPPGPQPHHAPGYNALTMAALRHQQLLEHFKQSNPALQALSPEATKMLAALMSAEQAQQHGQHTSPLLQPSAAAHFQYSSSGSRPPSSSSVNSQQATPATHRQSPVPPLSEAQLHQLQQHLGLQQLHLQHKLALQARHASHQQGGTQHQTGSASSGLIAPTACPMSSAGCELQFRSAAEMQAHFLACHV